MAAQDGSGAAPAASERGDAGAAWSVFQPGAFDGRGVLVTGAAGGLGAETAAAFAAYGARVVATDLDAERLEATVDRCTALGGGPHTAVAADIGTEEGVAEVFAAVDRAGRIDHVVTCAAVITARSALEMDRAHWRRLFDINVLGSFFVIQESYRRMLPNAAGTVVAVGSDAGKRGGGGLIADGAYAASKASVLSLVKSFAREFAGSGVRINALTPGPADTPLHAGVSEELKERIGAGLPIGRMGRADELAAAALFLSTDGASFVYGASFNADGGSMFE